MKKRTLFIALVLAAAIALCGCKGDTTGENSADLSSNTQTEPVYGGTLVYGMTQDLVSLDPHQVTDAGTRSVVFNLYEGLVKCTPAGDLEPAVASDLKISEDAKVYTFTLREGLTFHNGASVTTKDVEYSLKRYAEIQGETSAFSVAIDSIDITDTTITITLTEPNSEFLPQLTVAIVPDGFTDFSAPVGSGPFKFVSYSVGDKLELAAFEDYRVEGLPYLDAVTFRFLPDVSTALTNLKAGTIDVLNYLTAAQVKELTNYDSEGFRFTVGNMNLVHAMFLNNAYEPLQDERVRQAICYAVDRDAINNFLFDGKSTILGTHMLPALQTWYNDDVTSVYSCDVERAKELLADAGYADGFDLVITVPSAYSQHVSTAEIIVEQLKMVGIRATVEKVEWSEWLENVYRGRQYQATVIGFDGQLNPSDWLAKYGSDASNNLTNYSNAEYDALLAKALAAVDTEEKAGLYHQMEMNLAEHAASVYIEDPADFVGMTSGFDGYTFYPSAVYDCSLIYQVK
ncbi:MAG: ABC transporter substrate-binding protein [Lachnospiraceae bacterium]|nr:ABC transporter substrate-binding protein [Lachnospiraceae bacterium]